MKKCEWCGLPLSNTLDRYCSKRCEVEGNAHSRQQTEHMQQGLALAGIATFYAVYSGAKWIKRAADDARRKQEKKEAEKRILTRSLIKEQFSYCDKFETDRDEVVFLGMIQACEIVRTRDGIQKQDLADSLLEEYSRLQARIEMLTATISQERKRYFQHFLRAYLKYRNSNSEKAVSNEISKINLRMIRYHLYLLMALNFMFLPWGSRTKARLNRLSVNQEILALKKHQRQEQRIQDVKRFLEDHPRLKKKYPISL